VRTPDVVTLEPGIFKVWEMEKIFRANEKVGPEVCGLLALGAFAGMRSSAISVEAELRQLAGIRWHWMVSIGIGFGKSVRP
jgi:hypothetical protein